MNLALTGGTGFVGQALVDVALDEGHAISALARREQAPRAGLSWVAGDIADADALAAMMRGADAAIHVAGVVNAPDAAGFERGNVEGTRMVLDAAKAAGVDRFVFVSSLSAREPDLSEYGVSKARAERLVAQSGLDWTMVRPPAIYGPRDREMLELFRAAKWGVVPIPARGRLSVIHVEDMARLLLALAGGGEESRGAVIEPDDGTVQGWSHREFARLIGSAVGRRVLSAPLPRAAMMLAARADRLLRGDGAKLTPDRVSYFSHPDWVVSEEARASADLWQPRIATPEGLRQTADWYRERRWL